MNGLEAKAKLLMTAIESIQYVSSGGVFRSEYAKDYDMTEKQAERELAKISCELTEPLWEQWRKVKNELKYQNGIPL